MPMAAARPASRGTGVSVLLAISVLLLAVITLVVVNELVGGL
jgi:hypothetical protein